MLCFSQHAPTLIISFSCFHFLPLHLFHLPSVLFPFPRHFSPHPWWNMDRKMSESQPGVSHMGRARSPQGRQVIIAAFFLGQDFSSILFSVDEEKRRQENIWKCRITPVWLDVCSGWQILYFFLRLFADASVEHSCIQIRLQNEFVFCESHFAITSKHVEETVGMIKKTEINKTSELWAELLVLF